MTSDTNPMQNPSAVPDDETHIAQDYWNEYQALLESDRQTWLSLENNELFDRLTESKDPVDQRLVAAFQTMKEDLEAEWTQFLELKDLFSQSKVAPSVTISGDPIVHLIFKDFWLAEGRIWLMRRFLSDTTTANASLAPRREAHAFARESLVEDLDQAEKKLKDARTKLVRRFKRHAMADDIASMKDITADFSQITKEINLDLIREFDRFHEQEKANRPFVRRAMAATAEAQSEALKQQAEKQVAQEIANRAQSEADAAQAQVESARGNEKLARHAAQLAQDEATAAKARADSAQINQGKAQDEAKLAQDRAKIAQDEAKVAQDKTSLAENNARIAHDKATDAWELMELFYENGYPKLDFYPVEYFVKRHGSSSSIFGNG